MQSDVLAFQQVSVQPRAVLATSGGARIKQMDLATLRLDGVSAAARALTLGASIQLY